MKPVHLFLLSVLSCNLVSAQFTEPSAKKSIIKLNLTAPVLKNYAAQYEHVISRRFSVAISGRVMPAATIPFRKAVLKEVLKEENALVSDIIDKAKMSNFAITPEVRFYLGKGYGQGFYIGPYYRFAKYTLQRTNITAEELEGDYNINVSGNLTSHTGGLLLGAQWHLGKRWGLDLWALGPNIGTGKGQLDGVSNQTLSADEQSELRRYLEDIDIPYTKESVYVSNTGGGIKLSGPWAGVRAGLLLTFRF